MALTVGELEAVVSVNDSGVDQGLGRAEGKLRGAVKKWGLVAGAAALAVGKGLLEVGQTFDEVEDTIRTGTGKTGAALKGLVNDAKAVGTTVPAKFSDVSVAVTELNKRLDLSGKPLRTLAGQFLNLSRITGTDLKTNIEEVTRAFGDWGIEAVKQPAALDAIYRASQATGAGIDQLASGLVRFGGPMRQLGFSFEETLALLGKFEKEGVNTNLVMGSMRIALGKMAKEGEAPVETLQRVMEKIKGAGDAGKANAIALELFGARAGPDMAAAIREGRFSIDSLVERIRTGKDTINKASDDTKDFAESWQILVNKGMVLVEPAARAVFGAVSDLFDFLAREAIPVVKDIGKVIGELAAFLRDNLLPVWEQIEPVAGPAIIALIGVSTAMWGLSRAGRAARAAMLFLLSPLRLVTGAGGKAATALGTAGAAGAVGTLGRNAKTTGAAVGAAGLAGNLRVLLTRLVPLAAAWAGLNADLGDGKSLLDTAGAGFKMLAAYITGNEEALDNLKREYGTTARTIEEALVPGLAVARDMDSAWRRTGGNMSTVARAVGQSISLAMLKTSKSGKQSAANLGAAVVDSMSRIYRSGNSTFRNQLPGAMRAGGRLSQGEARRTGSAIAGIIRGIDLYGAGYTVVDRFARGMAAAKRAAAAVAAAVAQAVRNMFPSSPAKDGPLSGSGDPLLSGRTIGARLARGMQDSTPQLARAAAGLAGAAGSRLRVPAIGTGGGSGGVGAGSAGASGGFALELVAGPGADSAFAQFLHGQIRRGTIRLQVAGQPVRVA